MIPYYLLIIIPLYYGVAEIMLQPNRLNLVAKKHSNNLIILFFVLWLVLLSLRHISCGMDLASYKLDFWDAFSIKFSDIFEFHGGVEPLYWVFNWVVGHIYSDFRFLIVVIAFLCVSVTGWFYWKESENPLLTILLFSTNSCYEMFYSGLRQSMAMLFVIPAYYFTKNKKLFPFILTILIAKCFHQSALIVLLLYPIFHIPLRSKYFVFVLLLVAFFFLMKVQIFKIIFPFLPNKYLNYSFAETASGYSVWLFFISLLVISFVVCDERKMTHDVLGLRNVLVLMTLIQGFAPIHALTMRMNYYFIMLFPIIIPKLLNCPKDGLEYVARLIKFFLILFLIFSYFFIVCNRQSLNLYPYKAFWE